MVMSLSDVLSKYINQEVIPEPEKALDKDATIVSVKFTIREAGKQDLALVLKMRLNKKTSEWKVFDLIGENISILDAKESGAPIIKSKGINAAIEALKKAKPQTNMEKLSEMTYESVPALWSLRAEIFKNQEIDLSAVKSIDSAGIAFLVQWSKALKGQKLKQKSAFSGYKSYSYLCFSTTF